MIEIVEVLGLLLAVIVSGIGAFYALAKLDAFSTFCEEGNAKAFKLLGAFIGAIMQYQGHYLDEEWNVREDTGKNRRDHPSARSRRIFGGWYYLGIWPFVRIHRYNFTWATSKLSVGEKQQEGEKKPPPARIVPRTENLNYILVKRDVYAIQMINVETMGMVRVDLTIMITARCVNVYKALFRVQNWMEIVINSFEPVLRGTVAEKTYEEIVKEKQIIKDDIAKTLGIGEEEGIVHEIEEKYGISIETVGIKSIDPSEDVRQMVTEAATKEWQAKRERESILVHADAKRQEQIISADGRAKAISTVAEAMGGKRKFAPDVVYLDTWREVGQGEGNTVIATGLEGLKEDASKFFRAKGGKK